MIHLSAFRLSRGRVTVLLLLPSILWAGACRSTPPEASSSAQRHTLKGKVVAVDKPNKKGDDRPRGDPRIHGSDDDALHAAG
jgi:hypothetical protein